MSREVWAGKESKLERPMKRVVIHMDESECSLPRNFMSLSLPEDTKLSDWDFTDVTDLVLKQTIEEWRGRVGSEVTPRLFISIDFKALFDHHDVRSYAIFHLLYSVLIATKAIDQPTEIHFIVVTK